MLAARLSRADQPGPVHYPDSDGMPMAENTLQFQWIVTLKENIDALLPDFVAGDLLWYPVEGDPKTRQAPDVLVAFGRPKGYRGSYRQWEEGGVAPQVVFEVLSPGNTLPEMLRKSMFYERFGVQEYYVYDPDERTFTGWVRQGGQFVDIDLSEDWTSPLLGVRFHLGDELEVFRPDGARFLTFGELIQRAESEQARAESEKARAESEKARAESEKARADEAEQRAAALAERLRALGVEL